MNDIRKLIPSGNGSAYEKDELRHGPPLSYVSEKMRSSLETLHYLNITLEREVPKDLPVPDRYPSNYSVYEDGLLSAVHQSFYYCMVSFLALNNLLGFANHEIMNEKLALSTNDFKKWLDSIDVGGSVNGLHSIA